MSESRAEAAPSLVLTRTLNAPRALVYRAWVEPERLARWWGPHGFGNTVVELDPRPGGPIRIDMAWPDGTIAPVGGHYVELDEPARLVFLATALPDESGRHRLRVQYTATFEDLGGKTGLTVHAEVIEVAPELAGAVDGMRAGWAGSLDKLEAEVDPGALQFMLSRHLKAPIDLVYRAWTEADRLDKWFGVRGFTTFSSAIDVRPGGAYRYGVRSPEGFEMWVRWLYLEVEPPRRLLVDVSFTDADGGVTRHPMAPDWPLHVLTEIRLDPMGASTILTMRSVPIDATPTERAGYDKSNEGRRQGWGGLMEQLDAYLAGA